MPCTCDSMCSYSTNKVVRVHDKRLGILQFVLVSAILVYVVVFNVVYSNQAFYQETPEGAVRVTLREPTINSCDPEEPDNECILDLRSKSELSYCLENDMKREFKKFNCTYLSAIEALQTFDSSALLTTRIEYAVWKRACDPNEDSCMRLWNVTKINNHIKFVADIERYTILIDNGAKAPTLDIMAEGYNFAGRMRSINSLQCLKNTDATSDVKGKHRTDNSPCYIAAYNPPGSKFDIFDLQTIIDAADFSLDDGSYDIHSLRYRGCTILVTIKYQNVWPWSREEDPVYSYELSVLKDSQFADKNLIALSPVDNKRIFVSRHGIRLVFITGGKFGKFDMMMFMLCMATSTWLLAVAAGVTEWVMLNILDRKGVYDGVKHQDTQDFELVHRMSKQGFEAYVDAMGNLKFRYSGVSENGGQGEQDIQMAAAGTLEMGTVAPTSMTWVVPMLVPKSKDHRSFCCCKNADSTPTVSVAIGGAICFAKPALQGAGTHRWRWAVVNKHAKTQAQAGHRQGGSDTDTADGDSRNGLQADDTFPLWASKPSMGTAHTKCPRGTQQWRYIARQIGVYTIFGTFGPAIELDSVSYPQCAVTVNVHR